MVEIRTVEVAAALEDNAEEDVERAENQKGGTPEGPVSLSKSWAISKAHVPTYSGGKIVHSKATRTRKNEETDNLEEDDSMPQSFILLPVGGDLAIVESKSGTTVRTLRKGKGNIVANADPDGDDDEGIDGDAIVSYALSWNDQMLLTVGNNQLIRQYNFGNEFATSASNNPLPVGKLWGRSGHTLPIAHIEFHVSDVFVATGSVDGTVRVWDVRGSFVTHVFRPMKGDGGHGMQSVTSVTWKHDVAQLILAIGRDDGSIVIHNLRDSSDVVVLRDHDSAVTSMDWSKVLDNIFITAARDGVLNVWKIIEDTNEKSAKRKKGKKKRKDSGPTRRYVRHQTIPIYERVERICLLPSTYPDLVLATAGSKGNVRIWRASKGVDESLSEFSCVASEDPNEAFGEEKGGYQDMVYCAHQPSVNDERAHSQLIVADSEHNILFMNFSDTEKDLSVDRTIVGYNDEILDLQVIPRLSDIDAPRRILVATNSAQVRLFDLERFSCDILDGHTATVLCVSVSPCGRFAATCGKDKTVRLWDLITHHCLAIGTGHTEAIGAVALSQKKTRYDVIGKAATNGGGSFVVTTSKDRTLKRWNLAGADEYVRLVETSTTTELKAFVSARAHDKDINMVSVAPNDSLIATASQDKLIKLWNGTSLQLQATLKGHKRGVWDCQFSPHDRVLASSSGDRTVKLWSLTDYLCVRTFQGHVASALRVRFLSSGLQLVSSGADGLIKLWTIRTNECEATLDGHIDKVWALDVSPDGKALVSGGADSQIVLWHDTTKEKESEKRLVEEQNILMEQRLANHLRHKEYGEALEIALELNKPRQTLKVVVSMVEDDIKNKRGHGLESLQKHIGLWSMERIVQILCYCRDWNTRARNSHVAMLVLQAVVTTIPVTDLAKHKEIPEILAGITPYAERHFDRLDRLYESSFLMDFALYSMGHLELEDGDSNETADFATWKTKSKPLVPPKYRDGRIQVGGSAIVEKRHESSDESSGYEVETLGESEDSMDEDD